MISWLFVSLLTYKEYKATKWKKDHRSFVFNTWGTDQSGVSVTCSFKTSHIHLRKVRAGRKRNLFRSQDGPEEPYHINRQQLILHEATVFFGPIKEVLQSQRSKRSRWKWPPKKNFRSKPPLLPGFPEPSTLPPARISSVPSVGGVWIFSGITHCWSKQKTNHHRTYARVAKMSD